MSSIRNAMAGGVALRKMQRFSHGVSGRSETPGMYYQQRHCDCHPEALQDSGLKINDMAQDLVLFAGVLLSKQGWHAASVSQLMLAKRSKIFCQQKPA